MKRMIGVAMVLLATGWAIPQAIAQTKAQVSRFYGGAEIGYTLLRNQTGEVNSMLVNTLGGTASAEQDKNAYLGRMFGGYRLTDNLGLELGYAQTNSYSLDFNGVTAGAVAYTGNASAKTSGIDYSVLIRPNAGTGMNKLFFRLGGHYLKTETSASITGGGVGFSGNSNVSGAGWLAGIGYDHPISNGADVRFSYTRLEKLSGQSESSADILNLGLVLAF